MGQEESKLGKDKIEDPQGKITRNNFIFEEVIGKGGFGKVCFNDN